MLSKNNIPILMYHNISLNAKDMYSVSLLSFVEQLKWLHQKGYSSLPLTSMLKGDVRDLDSNKKYVIITFDDGNLDNYIHAYPLLLKYGFEAVFFVIASLVGRPGKMNWDQLRDIVKNGFIVGSHGLTHKPLGLLSPGEIRHELKLSKLMIEKELGTSVDFFSPPKGSYNLLVKKAAREVGYELMFTSDPGYNNFTADTFALRRFAIKNNPPLSHFVRIIKKDNRKLLYSHIEQFVLKTIKNIIGYNNYLKYKNKLMKASNTD